MYPSSFEYHLPNDVDEAIRLMQQHEDAKLLAGGHSLLPAMKLRLATPAHVIDLRKLRGFLQYVRRDGETIAVGALSTYADLLENETVKANAPLLAQTLHHVGDMQVRNLGTLGGSLAHADPAGDPPAAILALEAELVIQGPDGKRTVAAQDFFHGFFETEVGPGEILSEIRIPKQTGGSSYQKFRHPASGYAVCGVAAVLEAEGETISKCRVGITGVAGGAYRAAGVEEALEGQPFSAEAVAEAANAAEDGIDALSDPFADEEYRRQLARTLTKRALMAAWDAR